MTENQQPLMTFVQYARNDGYAPNYEKRINLSIKNLIRQAETFMVPIEVLIVEWNPPTDKPSLKSILSVPNNSPFAIIRIITVPPEYHTGFRGAAVKGLHPARALNVGYRRAQGKFVTPFASDSLLSDALFDHASTSGFESGKIYRLDRYDIEISCLDILNEKLSDQFWGAKLTEANILNHHAPQDETLCIPLDLPLLHTNAAGDFLLMSRTMWYSLCGQPESCDVACLDTDSITLHAAASHGWQEIRLPDKCRIYKIAHDNMSQKRVTPIWNLWSRSLSALIRIIASSPAKRAFLRGICDIPRRRLANIPGTYVSFERNFFLCAKRWAKQKKPVKLNDENWGLKAVTLKETSC